MSVQYKTIDEVIAALRALPIDTQLTNTVYLQKFRIRFFPSCGVTNQDHQTVDWTSDDFQDIDMTTSRSSDKSYSPACTTTGQLVDELQKVSDANVGKTYAITFEGRLLTGSIVKIVPEFVINQTSWSQTTLADPFKQRLQITNSLTKFLANVDETDETKLFTIVQRLIEAIPSCPADYVAYCVKKQQDNGYFVFHTKADAEDCFKTRGYGQINDDQTTFKLNLSSINLFKKVQPKVYLLDTQFLDQITAKMTEVQQLVKTITL